MSEPYTIEIEDWRKAEAHRDDVEVGRHFAFAKSGVDSPGRLGRLLARGGSSGARVLPIGASPVRVAGAVIRRSQPSCPPLAALACDRDLYRAEQDDIRIFAVVPSAPSDVRLHLSHDGAPLTERALDLAKRGVALEVFSALLPGRYHAELRGAGNVLLGRPIEFTVAEYTLAPLTARLLAHGLDRAARKLTFTVAVTSYGVALDGAVDVELIDGDRAVDRVRLAADEPGRFSGALRTAGASKTADDQPLRLRVIVADDPSRTAEVGLPGSRAADRDHTVISELGTERFFSVLAEPKSIPIRGGHVTDGADLSTPFVVPQVVTDRPTIDVRSDAASLAFVVVDLSTGEIRTHEHGPASAGDSITVPTHGPISAVSVGAFVDGRPFEGFTTFLADVQLTLAVDAPATLKPSAPLAVELRCDRPASVLLTVRDARLSAAETPSSQLAAATKAGIAAWTEGLGEDFRFRPLMDRMSPMPFEGFPMVLSSAMPTAAPARPRGGLRGLVTRSMRAHEPQDFARPMISEAFDLDEAGGLMMQAKEGGAGFEPASAPASEAPAARTAFAEVLFCEVVPVDRVATVEVPLSDALATYVIEAFAVAQDDWVAACTQVQIDQPVRVDLDVPAAVHAGDDVRGTLTASTSGGRMRVSLTVDGQPVEVPAEHETSARVGFDVSPGSWCATVEDLDTGERDSVEVSVAEPGRLRTTKRAPRLLKQGESIDLDGADALSLRLLASLDAPFDRLVDATASYAHLCCEQTAAKILSAVLIYLSAPEEKARNRAQQIIESGIAREQKMWRSGEGFAMYPSGRSVSTHYSKLATRYLWSLRSLVDVPNMQPSLRDAVQDGLRMADDAGRFHHIEVAPPEPTTLAEAYAVAATHGRSRAGQVARLVESMVDLRTCEVTRADDPQVNHLGGVSRRAGLAYAAAALLAIGRVTDGVLLANEVMKAFDGEGRLYSTVDSVAAIGMMTELSRVGLLGGRARVRVNGRTMSIAEAEALSDQVETVEVLEGAAVVEISRIVEDAWPDGATGAVLDIRLEGAGGGSSPRLSGGSKVELVARLPGGYEIGDLVHICLPPCLSWLKGGGRVQRFSVDFEGAAEVRVPLVVTGALRGLQHYAVCVRNMFDESRAIGRSRIPLRSA